MEKIAASFLLLSIASTASAFTAQSCGSVSRQTLLSSSSPQPSDFDFEYVSPNPEISPDEGIFTTPLSSVYPPGTPAGMRGEAVRSAIRSGRCVGWDLSTEATLSPGGALKIRGKGTRTFLNNKLTQSFSAETASSSYQEACFLDPKGRVVDRLRVALVDDETAYVLTSPGHTSEDLLKRLDPFVFPLDEITLENVQDCFLMTLASVQREHVQKVLMEQFLPKDGSFSFPTLSDEAVTWTYNDDISVVVLPSVGLPPVAAVGYTMIFHGNGAKDLISKEWATLIGDDNPDGPIGIGGLEYETLRIEAGMPAYGQEIGSKEVKASPLELHWENTINLEKGCYLGQEGIASILKNPRGPPRTLYSVIFEDSTNLWETQSRGDRSGIENLTHPPRVGQTLYALGSNEELLVGTLTSVAEAAGTGDPTIVGLAMVRRADSIRKKMDEMGIEIFKEPQDIFDVTESSGMIEPPPLDPLDGLEVVVEGTFTVGKLNMVPSRRFRKGKNMFDIDIVVEDFECGPQISYAPTTDDEAETGSDDDDNDDDDDDEALDFSKIQAEAEAAEKEAEAAAAEARRKAEKMEMLRKRAQEAMAKRKQKKQ
ncbi:unnamed protein product [Cylindrotheca closterium]|uniref:Aminomethyltransferase folate-binding domain-containing protein n=1 Tax=Cylindrotheca closterium TaxID=2856 RepID=A0AAD2FLB9_9STRA|nr:unnamed protein product [Cylindrotheca closterium]